MMDNPKAVLLENIGELEIAMHNSTGVEAMQMAGVLTATKKKLEGKNQLIINPGRLSPQERSVEALRMKERWHGCRSIDDL